MLSYMILYMPTLALVNAVVFRQLTNTEKEFPTFRVWGTIGWIAAGLLIGWFAWEQKNLLVNTFRMGAISSLVLGIICFFMPNTPPSASGKKVSFGDIIGVQALGLLKDRNFLVFFISSLLICVPLAFYYQEANKFLNEINLSNAAAKMTLGQMSETIFMVLMPFFFIRLGTKKMLLIGMGAWLVRYVFFAYGDTDSLVSFVYLGILLHGICYDFFFVTGHIYTDKKAGPEIKSAAQGLITLATYGVGMLIGFSVAGQITESFRTADGHDWQTIWLIPAGISFVVMLLFTFFFTDNKKLNAG